MVSYIICGHFLSMIIKMILSRFGLSKASPYHLFIVHCSSIITEQHTYTRIQHHTHAPNHATHTSAYRHPVCCEYVSVRVCVCACVCSSACAHTHAHMSAYRHPARPPHHGNTQAQCPRRMACMLRTCAHVRGVMVCVMGGKGARLEWQHAMAPSGGGLRLSGWRPGGERG